jgi:hypothetical protein
MSESEKLAAYEATLRRQELEWQALNDRVNQSDQAAVDIGVGALKTIILINAGAIVAFLAFVGQLWKDDPLLVANVLHASMPFVVGIIFSSVAYSIAYIYQSMLTYKFQCDAFAVYSPNAGHPEPSSLDKPLFVLIIAMVLFAFIGLGSFICGAKKVIRVFDQQTAVYKAADGDLTDIPVHKLQKAQTTSGGIKSKTKTK